MASILLCCFCPYPHKISVLFQESLQTLLFLLHFIWPSLQTKFALLSTVFTQRCKEHLSYTLIICLCYPSSLNWKVHASFIFSFLASGILPATWMALEKYLQGWFKEWRVHQNQSFKPHSARTKGYGMSWVPSNYSSSSSSTQVKHCPHQGLSNIFDSAHLDGAKDLTAMGKRFRDHH